MHADDETDDRPCTLVASSAIDQAPRASVNGRTIPGNQFPAGRTRVSPRFDWGDRGLSIVNVTRPRMEIDRLVGSIVDIDIKPTHAPRNPATKRYFDLPLDSMDHVQGVDRERSEYRSSRVDQVFILVQHVPRASWAWRFVRFDSEILQGPRPRAGRPTRSERRIATAQTWRPFGSFS